ncbi:branched-chain amino acid transport system II carrier protein [Oligella ureolytica]
MYLSIGPLFALPRTGTVAFEVGVKPFLGAGVSESLVLLLFSIVFFALAYFLAMNPGKLIDRIGKILTPALLLGIAILGLKTY